MKIWTQEEEAERLADKLRGINKSKFARDHKIPGGPSMISQHLSGNRPISLDAAVAYATAFNCSIEEISPRIAINIARAKSTSVQKAGIEPGPEIKGEVPLISWVQAGHWKEVIDIFDPSDHEWLPTTYKVRRHTYALRVCNDSMVTTEGNRSFPEGCIIIVEPEEEAVDKSFVIVRQNGNEATFKQLIRDGGRWYLKPLNKQYDIMELQPDAVICGVVKKMEMDV